MKEFNTSLAAQRVRIFRNDKRFNSRLNKNLISITAISYCNIFIEVLAIGKKIHRQVELTNEVMNKLQGS